MKVLIGCEFSGAVRRAFRRLGHNAWSCDLLPAEDESPYHIQGDVFDAIHSREWDLGIFHPPCTRLAVSGARWFKFYRKEQEEALRFVQDLLDAPIKRIALENPVSVISSRIRKPTQIIQPWMFGKVPGWSAAQAATVMGETKATCLWLKNLPKLVPTMIVAGRIPRVHLASPGPERWKERSRTLPGIAAAMASQWGKL